MIPEVFSRRRILPSDNTAAGKDGPASWVAEDAFDEQPSVLPLEALHDVDEIRLSVADTASQSIRESQDG